jgi:hypothetical protein
MKALRFSISIIVVLYSLSMNKVLGQWTPNGAHIYNTNAGNVGVGTNAPSTLLYVAKNMAEPAITVRNLGGSGGATYVMTDNASGANWKFKATNDGGFKIRDNANSLDPFVIEANSAPNALYINSAGNKGIGTSNPASSAALDINSTTKGYLPPRLTPAQIAGIQSPANGLIVYNYSDEHVYIYSSLANTWKRVEFDAVTITPWPCGSSFTFSHTAGTVAPVTKTVTYGTVMTNLTGSDKCWITQNLGADHQATSVNDATEESAGWYWQFNRQQGYKHDLTTRTPNTTWISIFNENSNWIAANDPCSLLLGSSWRLPTSVEWSNADASGGWTDWNGPWNSDLKMHAAGYLYYFGGSLYDRGSYGSYWSSSQTDSSNGWNLSFVNYCSIYSYDKAFGLSIRCLGD